MRKLTIFLLLFILSFTQLVHADLTNIDTLWESLEEAQGPDKLKFLKQIEYETFSNLNGIIKEASLAKLNHTEVDPEYFFKERVDKYQKYLAKIDFKKDLKGLRENGLDYLDKNVTTELKELRGRANKVRTAFYVFDETHEAPEEFRSFVAQFGKLNDAIASKNNKKIKLRAVKTLDAFKEIEEVSLKKSFAPLSEKKFRSYLETLNGKINLLLEQKTISVEDYHTLRKDLKQIHSSYEAILSFNDIAHEESATSLLLDDLIDQMGKLNDIYTDLEITKAMELEDHTLKLSAEMRKNFKLTLEFFKTDLCDLKFQ